MIQIIPKISSFLKKVYPIEIISVVAITSVINYLYYFDDPGFLDTRYNPYLIVILFFSIFYGKLSGAFSLALSIIAILINSMLTNSYPTLTQHLAYLYSSEDRYNSLMQFIFVTFFFSIIFGEIRDSLGNNLRHHNNQNEILQTNNIKLQHELDAVSLVNEEYQDRILGQQNSLISLYSTMIELNTLDLEKIYPNILDAIVKFSGATKCSLWQYMRDYQKLDLLSSYGWTDKDQKSMNTILDSDNITGWVARNNVMFSIKMLQKHQPLQKIDTKQNILTVPITIENKVWGIINIEDMPFVKYNLYSEQLIMMISDLAAPIIRNAIRFSDITKKGEIDPITGLYSFAELFVVFKEEFTRAKSNNLNLSLIITELSNYEDLLEEYSNEEILYILREISQLVMQITKGKAMIFQYKETFQFSAILPNMDYDGAAMFCLTLIERHGNQQYKIRGELINPEIIMGYSSIRPNTQSEEDLIMLAENLLMMQKL